MGKKGCKHNELVKRLQGQGKFGEQEGYCSQQCKKTVKLFVPKPKEEQLTKCSHCLCMTKTIAGVCLKCKKEK